MLGFSLTSKTKCQHCSNPSRRKTAASRKRRFLSRAGRRLLRCLNFSTNRQISKPDKLKAGLWFRRSLFVTLSPVHGSRRRVQGEFPLIQVVQISRASSEALVIRVQAEVVANEGHTGIDGRTIRMVNPGSVNRRIPRLVRVHEVRSAARCVFQDLIWFSAWSRRQ
jgi:hypothetical protein